MKQNEGVRFEAITWERLTEALADRLVGIRPGDGGSWPRVAVDGAPAARPEELARRLAGELRLRGHAVRRVDAHGFLRPASLRFEYGRRNPDAYYEEWFDRGALRREVFTPLDPGGRGRVLPDLWDSTTDRATRSAYVDLPPGGLLVLHGPLLLGQWFPFDFVVRLRLSPLALARLTPHDEQWTLPAFARYEDETGPDDAADVVVRADDPRRPAWSGFRRVGR